MMLNRLTHAVSKLVLRTGFVLALLLMLAVPHAGMTATPHMTQHYAGHMMGHMGGAHDRMHGALCAMVCASACKTEAPAALPRVEKIALVVWDITTKPYWASQHPDPAQRPPDTALSH
jgi:alcohol dehydrogenase YqhD (iron-dependent ADH family)